MTTGFPKLLCNVKLLANKPVSAGFNATLNPVVDALIMVIVSLITDGGDIVVGDVEFVEGMEFVEGAEYVGELDALALMVAILAMTE